MLTSACGDAEGRCPTIVPAERALGVAHISPASGGVAHAARRLHAGLLGKAVNSRFFDGGTLPLDGCGREAYRYSLPNRPLHLAARMSRYIDRRLGFTAMSHGASLPWSFRQV